MKNATSAGTEEHPPPTKPPLAEAEQEKAPLPGAHINTFSEQNVTSFFGFASLGKLDMFVLRTYTYD